MRGNTPAFLETTFNPEGFTFDTKVAFVQNGEYEIELLRFADGTYRDKDTQYFVPAIRVQWLICSPEVQEEMGIPDPQAQQFIQLEFDGGPFETADAIKERGKFAMAKNRNTRLAKGLLDPLGFNKGKPWSFSQMLHARAWGRIELPNDEEISMFSNVVAVASKQSGLPQKRR